MADDLVADFMDILEDAAEPSSPSDESARVDEEEPPPAAKRQRVHQAHVIDCIGVSSPVPGDDGNTAASSVAAATTAVSRTDRIDDDWRLPLQDVLRPHWSSAGWQLRPLVVDSLFSGTATEMYALRRGGMITATARVAAEKDPAAWLFCQSDQATGAPHECWFTCARALASTGAAMCLTHGREHAIPDGPADLLVAGIVCKPFSFQRVGRWGPGGAQAHPDFDLGDVALKYIARTLPSMVLLENVLGWDCLSHSAEQDELTAMEDTSRRLRESGYTTMPIRLDTDTWSVVARPRIYIMAARTASSLAAVAMARDLVLSVVRARASRLPSGTWMIGPGDDGHEQKCLVLRGRGGDVADVVVVGVVFVDLIVVAVVDVVVADVSSVVHVFYVVVDVHYQRFGMDVCLAPRLQVLRGSPKATADAAGSKCCDGGPEFEIAAPKLEAASQRFGMAVPSLERLTQHAARRVKVDAVSKL